MNQVRVLNDFLFRILPCSIVTIWATVFVMSWPFHDYPPDAPTREPEIAPPGLLHVRARKVSSAGARFFEKAINLSETVVYLDMWRSHWCTYYNDREFFFTPRINEAAQLLRTLGLPVVHISMGADAWYGSTRYRRAGREAVARGNLSVLEQYNAQAAKYHKNYIPGFVDTCVYTDQERWGKYRDNHLTKTIAVAEDDYLVQNFKESAEAFVGLGAKTVLVLGQHTNMCLMAVFLYCREVGLDLVIVRDLVDSAWLYELQKNHSKTNSEGNEAVNNYFDEVFGSSVLSYDLIRAIKRADVRRVKPQYSMHTDVAFMFKAL
jgi:hypothetical protein